MNKSRKEVVALLKNSNGAVRLVVSRQDDQENENTTVRNCLKISASKNFPYGRTNK